MDLIVSALEFSSLLFKITDLIFSPIRSFSCGVGVGVGGSKALGWVETCLLFHSYLPIHLDTLLPFGFLAKECAQYWLTALRTKPAQ